MYYDNEGLNLSQPTSKFLISSLTLDDVSKNNGIHNINKAKKTIEMIDTYFKTDGNHIPVLISSPKDKNNELKISNTKKFNVYNYEKIFKLNSRNKNKPFFPDEKDLKEIHYERDDAEIIKNLMDGIKMTKIKIVDTPKKEMNKSFSEKSMMTFLNRQRSDKNIISSKKSNNFLITARNGAFTDRSDKSGQSTERKATNYEKFKWIHDHSVFKKKVLNVSPRICVNGKMPSKALTGSISTSNLSNSKLNKSSKFFQNFYRVLNLEESKAKIILKKHNNNNEKISLPIIY